MYKKIHILYDARHMITHLLNKTGTGIYTVSIEVLKELSTRKKLNLQLYCDQKSKNELQKALKKAPKNLRKLKIFDANDFESIDVFFSTLKTFPIEIKNQPNIQKYLFLYDAIPLLHHEYWEGQDINWFFDMFQAINKNDFYFADSLSTQKDFIKYNMNITKNNSMVVPLAASDNFYHEKDDKKIKKVCKKYNIPTDKKYVFSLCTLEPRKNLIRSVKTFIEFIKKNNIDDMVYVLGGAHWDKFIGKLEKEIQDFGNYKDKIIRAGYVADEDLAVLYSGAKWFVYTSQYEGFGLPPLEAMKCGCPVITSNNSSLPEVVGDAGIMIDYDSDEQHIAAYEKYYFDENYRKEMAKKGYERSKQFSWDKTVNIIINEINKG